MCLESAEKSFMGFEMFQHLNMKKSQFNISKLFYRTIVCLVTRLQLYETRAGTYLGCFKQYVEDARTATDINHYL